jgi:hypothetical protein
MEPTSQTPMTTPWAILGACLLIALLGQAMLIPVDADVSWLITVSERVLAGQRLYVDIFEVNPPASVWLYLPQVALAQALGLRPEAVIVAVTAALAFLSSALTLKNAPDRSKPALLAMALGFAALILPGGLFAQREHYALLLALPLCAMLARQNFSNRITLAAGLISGLLMVIKPHFALAIAFPAGFALWRSREWRPFLIAGAVAAFILFLYALAIWQFAPAYADRLDMLRELYLPMRERWARLLYGPVVLFPAALALLLSWLRKPHLSAFAITLALAALGFTLAALIQGKGYWNHALPAVGLMIVAVVAQASIALIDKRRLAFVALAAVGLGCLSATARIGPPPGLVETLRRVGPANPTMIALGTELATGHPAVRLVDGRWVGSRAALFTAAGVRYRGGRPSANLERWYREDLATVARDIRAGRPDVILVETDDRDWLVREPEIQPLLAGYRTAGAAKGIEIWVKAP